MERETSSVEVVTDFSSRDKNKKTKMTIHFASQRVWSLIRSTLGIQESFWVDKNDLHRREVMVESSQENIPGYIPLRRISSHQVMVSSEPLGKTHI